MDEIVSRLIDDDEILVRFLFRGDFKRKKSISIENINKREVFLDTRGPQISLLRERYNDETECKDRGLQITTDLVGFVIFQKEKYIKIYKNYKENIVNHFDAELRSSPLDENLDVIPESIDITRKTPISPAHADLTYINPGIDETAESTNLAIKRFSEFLFKDCKVVMLEDIEEEVFKKVI
ncbi:hypothetical protein GWA97_02790 [Flavobacterium sp. LaA7.5]|nr:hypothetical protein [Flavobacterium salilacus subsp. altitudinum]